MTQYLTASIYPVRVNNKNTRARCEMCSELTIKTPELGLWCRSCVFICRFEHISHLVLVFLLLTLNIKLLTGLYKIRVVVSQLPLIQL